MTDREKLVELIMNSGAICYTHTAEELADHLIANDVVPVVRCKDCKDCVAGYCAAEIDGVVRLRAVKPDDFCAWGERKDND